MGAAAATVNFDYRRASGAPALGDRPRTALLIAASHAYFIHLTISGRVGLLPYIRMPTR